MNLPHIDLHLQESGSRILHLPWFFVGASGLYLLQFNGDWCERDLVMPVSLDHWNAENRDRVRIRICGFGHSTINGFLIMGPNNHSQLIMLCYVDVGQTLFFQDGSGRIPRSDRNEARVGRSDG
jgi:hypothetical protein